MIDWKELQALIQGEVFEDAYTLSLYATDASLFEITPKAVVWPKHHDDVVKIVIFANQHKISVIARGAGSGLTGESIGSGIIIDFSVYMNKIHDISAESTVWVETGTVLDVLNKTVLTQGLVFPPDPSSSNRATIGGILGNNSTGAHSIIYGSARRWVLALKGVWSTGESFHIESSTPLNQESLPELLRPLWTVLTDAEPLIEQFKPKVNRNSCGYLLEGVLEDSGLDLVKLLVGSQGTLGIVTSACLQLLPKKPLTGMVVVFFKDVVSLCEMVPKVLIAHPSAVEMMDDYLVELASHTEPDFAKMIPQGGGCVMFVEVMSMDEASQQVALDAIVHVLETHNHPNMISTHVVQSKQTSAMVMEARKKAVPLLFQRKDRLIPVPSVEDCAVPVEHLAEYVQFVQSVFAEHHLPVSYYAHAGHGELHIRPFMNMRDENSKKILDEMANRIFDKVLSLGGVISGEHSDGLSRTPFIAKQYGKLYDVFKEIKSIFDPHYLLNPGKKIHDEHISFQDISRFGARQKVQNLKPLLSWSMEELESQLFGCNGNAHCRASAVSQVDMCPRYRETGIEHASPRAKANFIRRVFTGLQPQADLYTKSSWDILEYCYGCGLCINGKSPCPSAIHIPKLVMEARSQYVAVQGLPSYLQFIYGLELSSRLGATFATLSNFFLSLPWIRSLIESTVGISRQRHMSFNKQALRPKHVTNPIDKVVYYVDLYARDMNPAIGQCLLDICHHLNIEVVVPSALRWSAYPLLEYGLLGAAKKIIQNDVDILSGYVDNGYKIIVSEPTATLCLKEEWADVSKDSRLAKISSVTYDVFEYLQRFHSDHEAFTKLKPVEKKLAYQQSCHHKRLAIGTPSISICQRIPKLQIQPIDKGCCGMAGIYGLQKRNYQSSQRIGRDVFNVLKDNAFQAGMTECSSCKQQMEEGTGKKVLHPLELLALSLF